MQASVWLCTNIGLSACFYFKNLFFQDGFFDGELIDGRRGLVPSNFIEKVAGKSLITYPYLPLTDVINCLKQLICFI